MIVDCFTFFNELDLLEIRLEELYPIVDRFVLVEADQTFRGNKKPLYFNDNKSRYEKFLDKIYYIKVELPNLGPWEREYFQRNKITDGLTDLSPNDIVMISDLDEIARRNIVSSLEITDRQMTLQLRRFTYGINMVDYGFASMKAIYYKDMTTPQQERMMPPTTIVPNSGWEFSSVGSPEYISEKLKSFSHAELDVERYTDPAKILERIKRGIDIIDRHSHVERVEIDDTWPEAIKNNRERYRHLEW